MNQREKWRALRDESNDWANFMVFVKVWIIGAIILWPLCEWLGWLP